MPDSRADGPAREEKNVSSNFGFKIPVSTATKNGKKHA